MIDIEKIKKVKGYEYTENSQGVLCVLVPVEEDIKNNKKLKALDIIKKIDRQALIYFLATNIRNKNEYKSLIEALL